MCTQLCITYDIHVVHVHPYVCTTSVSHPSTSTSTTSSMINRKVYSTHTVAVPVLSRVHVELNYT